MEVPDGMIEKEYCLSATGLISSLETIEHFLLERTNDDANCGQMALQIITTQCVPSPFDIKCTQMITNSIVRKQLSEQFQQYALDMVEHISIWKNTVVSQGKSSAS